MILERVAPQPQRRHHGPVAPELDEVETPERGRVLVLPAARELQVHALDAIGQLGEVVRREIQFQPLAQHREQRHHERARGAEPRAGRSVRVRPQVGAAADFQRPHRGLQQVERAVDLDALRVLVLGDHVVVERGEREPRVAARPQ
jgi:hypothetical protein